MNPCCTMRQWGPLQWALFVSMVALVGLTIAIAALGSPASTVAAPKQLVDPIKVWLNGDNGVVTIRVRVNADGRVERVLDNSASQHLRPLYAEVAKRWVFTPATRDGDPVMSDVTIRFNYTVTSTYVLVEP